MAIRYHSRRSLRSLSALCLALVPVGAIACAAGSDPVIGDESDPLAPLDAPALGAPVQTLLERYKERLARNPYTDLKGYVTTIGGAPLEGVTVRAGQSTAVTDASGAYALKGVALGGYAVSFEHPDYVFAQRRVTLESTDSGWLTQELLRRNQRRHIDADSMGIVQEGPLTLEFEPGDLVVERDKSVVHGDVEVMVTAIDPRVPGHIFAAPAELEGITAAGEQVGLFSYGMLEVELWQGNRRVNVREGETVKVSLDVTKGVSPEIGDRIPMWHHDTNQGIWIQERGTDALVQERDGVRLAVAELPHFSAWNYDVLADGICAPLVVPASLNVSRVRVISTDALGNPVTGNDANGYPQEWSISFDCAAQSRRSSRCAVNVPAGNYFAPDNGDVYFKLQAQTANSSTWCDLNLELNGTTGAVWKRSDVNAYTQANNISNEGSWCGNQTPTPPWVSGSFDFTLNEYTLPTNLITFGIPQSSSCPDSVGAMAIANDSGFKSMASNAANVSYMSDYDRDGIWDKSDKCVGKRSTNQADADSDGIGDLCEALCYIPEIDPYASWYDYDGDGVDDYCDINWITYNPSQYSTCTHDKCASGASLVSDCEPCTASICAVDPYCCNMDWDSICVSEVQTVCNIACN